ncbi:MAG: sorbosone dehydrogenase [Gemmatimonadota bacterium]
MRRSLLLLAPLSVVGALLAFRSAPSPTCDPDNGGLTLPKGFCATVYATLPGVRHVAVAPNGDVFATGGRAGVTALRDRKGTGHADTTATFGGYPGSTGIALGADALYYAPNERVIRFTLKSGSLLPSDTGRVIVSGLPVGNHSAKTLALSKDGKSIFVDQGSATNICLPRGASVKSQGPMPCPELPTRAGIWRYDVNKFNQTGADGERWATGVRNGMALAVEPTTGVLGGATHGRDDLHGALGVSDEENAEKPAEEFGIFAKGDDWGWPYFYFDPITKKKVQGPEYGGDGVKQGECATKAQPVIGFPGHWAPLALNFVPAKNSFGPEYASGAFLAFHGSWNRAPMPQAGFRIVFIPFKNGKAIGTYSTFADATAGQFKLSGVAMAPDGSALYVASDNAGKIWRIIPTPSR